MTHSPITTFRIPRRLIDQRLDKALSLAWPEIFPDMAPHSRTAVARLIVARHVSVNGRHEKPTYLVKLGDSIEIDTTSLLSSFNETLIPDTELKLSVIFENEAFVVINKPAGILIHPAGRKLTGTVANWVIDHYPEAAQVGENALRPGIVHRLDQDTSGLLVIAKTNEAFAVLKALFQERAITKTYVAVVHGHLTEKEGVIERPLAQPSGALKRRIVAENDEKGRFARTKYRVLVRNQATDVVLVMPETGRTHQIRAHFAYLRHPIVGDRLYSFKGYKALDQAVNRQLLHAWKLDFVAFGEKFALTAPLPEDFRNALLDEEPSARYDDEALKSLL